MPKLSKQGRKDKKLQKELGYREWRRRELERLIIYSGSSVDDKLLMLQEVQNEQSNQRSE